MTAQKKANKLLNEKSPYLLQHAYNPVQWFPWGEEAFKKAKAEGKPVFLSIGYATCHWCHVMERESFEDEEVAALLNEHFIAIKVDREERPDIDQLYMNFCQRMTGHGGWPLTILATPTQKPFFAGTYFPKYEMSGRTGLLSLLSRMAQGWKEEQETIEQFAQEMLDEQSSTELAPVAFNQGVFQKAFDVLTCTFDETYGGFGDAPKFPSPHQLSFLIAYGKNTGEDRAVQMVETTLKGMYNGGLFDHIGGGFSRYSVDEKWLVPHFEKMLYDNALLSIAAIETYQATEDQQYADIAHAIFAYVKREMTSEQGAFFSAEDADSEGEEGRYYVWTPSEVTRVLGQREGETFCRLYGISEDGNFEGKSIPNLLNVDWEEEAKDRELSEQGLKEHVKEWRDLLLAARSARVPPLKDDKVLTSWNGLMIAAYAKAGKVLQSEDYIQAAKRADDFLWTQLRREDGRLMARYRDGDVAHLAYLDDYVAYSWGLIELYEATFDHDYLIRALELTQDLLRLFWDENNGGFYFYGEDGEQLLQRPKPGFDGAMPSGNGMAAANILRLSKLTGNIELQGYAQTLSQAFGQEVKQAPHGFTSMLRSLYYATERSREIVIVGVRGEEKLEALLQLAQTTQRPGDVLLFKDMKKADLSKVAPFTAEHNMMNDEPTLYVCENFSCQMPLTGKEAMDVLTSR
ncbi:thioredoxin domain-containing protein [Aureibacillus halotolerans]|uniref:Spermatogenesis-associated protein 20-like TRX domain-containing protein n=1 Tax=Aureibacillus halotolerans TaxID=1508390 RepID=A0A4R6UDW8_9BACI|nr:thioredoxin domain-containing protein [Aureibacillus halotolerans]TDQ43005.1 hypothetical protein EV213_101437 [Aureibacillus halotolerans]